MVAQLCLLLFQPLKTLSDRRNGPEKTVWSYGSSPEVFSVLSLIVTEREKDKRWSWDADDVMLTRDKVGEKIKKT